MIRICVPSSGRPGNVTKLQALVDMPLTWYVPEPEAAAYVDAGARVVSVPGEPGDVGRLVNQRNMALRDCFLDDATCIQLDDDLRRLRHIVDGELHPITLSAAVRGIMQAMTEVGAKLGGIYPVFNRYFSKGDIRTCAFIRGSLMVVAPNLLKFDRRFPVKMDYDYTLQHLMAYGVVARVDAILADFPYKTNGGGLQQLRTPQLMDECNRRLMQKWPGRVRQNVRRPGEVSLIFKRQGSSGT